MFNSITSIGRTEWSAGGKSRPTDDEREVFTINNMNEGDKGFCEKILFYLGINGQRCKFELDKGAAVSTISLRKLPNKQKELK